jgi:hypothetical protein
MTDRWLRGLTRRRRWRDRQVERKEIRQLDRQLTILNMRINADMEFDYARRAEVARTAQEILHKASTISRGRPGDLRAREIHNLAAGLFRKAVDAAYPAGFWRDYRHLKERNSSGLAAAVKFLEADPWFFRSGYTKADLIRFIKHVELPQAVAERLRQVVVAAIDSRDRREYRQYCRLARYVDSAELRDEISLRLEHDDPAVRRRARWAMNACEKPG